MKASAYVVEETDAPFMLEELEIEDPTEGRCWSV
ncbi:Zn-dependent alcohol dehydrogenase [Nesterenkonia lacusekhoensis]|uniref:Zn-dependent alcohol dehydrogenase n=1 Tax=Nesterenkonia lacusekhoensis TaxID=150832 RepID=A0ABS4T3X9_9MICC|nr:Zn-dependent alcohol dehydrogenase [Nesterenkonia lacusekhoensis]